MKTKIQIKSIWGSVLFEYEKEKNSVRETLIEAVKRGTDLGGAYLGNADLRGADLRGADLRCAYLRGADLRCAYLGSADLRGADLRCAYLGSADLRGADLRCAYLRGTDLGDADLRGAYLDDADLRCADLGSADLGDADLGEWGKINKPSDILTIGAIGSRNSQTTIFHTDKGVFVNCGCFKGSLEEFENKVKETHHGNKHERDYLALIQFAKIKFEL